MDVEVFVGDLDDPNFNYVKGNWNGNCPKRISVFFPSAYKLFFEIINKIDGGQLEGKQTDWGSWTAPLYPEEIIEVMKEYYGDEKYSLEQSIREIVNFLKDLPQDKKYGLVACEMP
ncbi:hypothetical protein ABES03_16300 [Neobacillus rhizosphaerae]|uniref:hypothetical protein n=1 Tax=Neobacillus rhizosphaerae TaxID=2880965 RepID=UPI003D2953D5